MEKNELRNIEFTGLKPILKLNTRKTKELKGIGLTIIHTDDEPYALALWVNHYKLPIERFEMI